MKHLTILAAVVLMSITCKAQDTTNFKISDFAYDSINTNGLIIDSNNIVSWYYSGTFSADLIEPECTYYSVSNRISFKGIHETGVMVNKYYGFELVQEQHGIGSYKWRTGYIYHYGIPIYHFEIDGELSVTILNKE